MTAPKPDSFLPHPGVDPSCPRCRGESFVVERRGSHAHALLCDCVRSCSRCRDTGFVEVTRGGRVARGRCRCQLVSDRIRNFCEAHIPAKHAHCTLATFDKSNPQILPTFGALCRYVNAFDPRADNRGVILYGEVGRGKTHLMVSILRDLIFRHGVTARFVEFSHLLADLRSTFDRRNTAAADLLEPLVRVQVLAIDELGKGRNNEWEGTVLDEIISRRYNAASTLLGTTNYAPGPANHVAVPNLTLANRRSDGLVGSAGHDSLPRLVDRVGDRVYSRIVEVCDLWQLKGPDYRLKMGFE